MKICQRGMIYRKMAHLPPLIVMTKQNTQYLTRKETRYASSMLIIKKNAQYTNMSIRPCFYIEVLPNFTNRDRLIDSALGSLNIAIIPIVLSISMICCVTFFYKKNYQNPLSY